MKAGFLFIKKSIPIILLITVTGASAQNTTVKNKTERLQLAAEIDKSIRTELLNKWYPQSVDSLYGGFLTTFTYNFLPTGPQDKMIVNQARHVWSNAIASRLYPGVEHYKKCAAQGFSFLKNKMWDKSNGGFYTLVDR
ncbi:MAG TPA: AGE family epimerase/isomerase, partial [Chitinophagaceae bacterium]|nr:AGE family epimerase/isomerase [Chitinophagaceae bacterium]